ncbi:ABC transporter permease [uncultured Clostridium sp.]|uniref:FtsX-like permease family protein n=1 Tax=uncultured Clostridium sp. TaxID=59620 RepID=UPI002635D702|nr:ABC transporter permease [uncultured Clostridium sp.]
MLLKNNNELKTLSNNLLKNDKRRNKFILMSVFLTTLLLTTVSYVGLTMYDGLFKISLEKEKLGVYSYDHLMALIGVVFLSFIVVGSGYLIIYNIFYISIINDIRFYGQLKTLGCTQKQLRKLIYKLGFRVSIVGIPFGVILGLFLGRIIAQLSLKETIIFEYIDFNNYIWPSTIGIIFTIITLWISIRKPVKMLEKISAVEAIKHNVIGDFEYKRKTKKTRNGSRIKNMAKENMIKNKKKVIASVLSIALSSTLLSAGMIIMIGLDVEEHVRRYIMGDIDIGYYMDSKIEREDIEKLEKLEGIKDINITFSGYEQEERFFTAKSKVEVNKNAMEKEFIKYESGYNFEAFDNSINTVITGMSKEMLKRNLDRIKVIEGKIDLEKFSEGNYIILNRENRNIENGLKVGDKITLNKGLRNKEFEVMAIIGDDGEKYISTSLGILTVSKENLEDLLLEKILPNKIVVDVEKNNRNIVLEEAKEIFKGKGSIKGVEEFKDGVRNLKTGILSGVFLGVIIFLAIAILNMVNIAITDLVQRKREFSSLEAIGMERRMLKRLLEYEGRYYLIFSIILIIPLSLITAFFIPKMIPIYGSFSLGAVGISVLMILGLIYLIMIVFKRDMLKNILNKESLTERLEEY